MIKVLKNWNEIGECTKFLKKKGLPNHDNAEKNWDFFQLKNCLQDVPKEAPIVDLGCGNLYTLNFLHAQEYQNLYGIDFLIGPTTRLRQIKRTVTDKRIPYKIEKGDLLNTPYADNTFELVISLSTIEHGVDLKAFFKEVARISKPGGYLFVTTDYWHEKSAQTPLEPKPFGLDWNVFDRSELDNVISVAAQNGLNVMAPAQVPEGEDKCVVWNGLEYTFACLIFKKN